MTINNIRQKEQVRKTISYIDTLSPGEVDLQTNSTDLEYDLNAIRSQIKRILDSTGGGDWFDDIPIVDLSQKGLKQLSEAISSLGSSTEQFDSFTPTFSQTVFTLSQIPIDVNLTKIFVNGNKLRVGSGYFISGTNLTISLDYNLDNNDDLDAYYFYTS